MSEEETHSDEDPADDGLADEGRADDEPTESPASGDRSRPSSPVEPKRPGSDALRSAAESAVAGAAVGGADDVTRVGDASVTSPSDTDVSARSPSRLAAPTTADDEPPNRLPVVMAGVLVAIVLLGAFVLLREGSGDGSGQAIDTESRVSIAERDQSPGATTTTETTTTTEATTTTAPPTTAPPTTTPPDATTPTEDASTEPEGDDPGTNPTVPPPPPPPPPPPTSSTSTTSPPTPAELSVTYPRDSQGRMVLLEGGTSAINIYNAGGSPGNYAVGASGDVTLLSPTTGTVRPGSIVTINVRAGEATDSPPPQGEITVAGEQGVIVNISVIIT